MFNGKFWQGDYRGLGTSMYEADGVVYRIDWKYMVGQVWLNWPMAKDPVREDYCG